MARLLVIDDDPALLIALSALLQARLYQVTIETTQDLSEALRRLQETEFDVIISDLQIPGTTDLQHLQQIRSLCPFVPVILITGAMDDQVGFQALDAGIFSILSKPLNRVQTVATIKRALQLRELLLQTDRCARRAGQPEAASLPLPFDFSRTP